jgi:hypothetical protein
MFVHLLVDEHHTSIESGGSEVSVLQELMVANTSTVLAGIVTILLPAGLGIASSVQSVSMNGNTLLFVGADVGRGVEVGYGVTVADRVGLGVPVDVRVGVIVGVADTLGVGVTVTLRVTDGEGGGTGEISGPDPPHPQHLLLTLLNADGTISGSAAGLIIIFLLRS